MDLARTHDTEISPPLRHPRPQMQREAWTSLNGEWQFSKGGRSFMLRG